jgi:hypothetical protein
MTEVTLRIRFTQPCLGAKPIRQRDGAMVYCMSRGLSGQVLFPPAWWRAIVAHGARVKGGSVALANRISWSLDVDGVPNRWARHVPRTTDRRGHQVYHEAFLPGDIVGVDCVLPPELQPDTFWRWMDAGGKYLGISPFKHGEWGRFEVVAVEVLNASPVKQGQPDEVTAD